MNRFRVFVFLLFALAVAGGWRAPSLAAPAVLEVENLAEGEELRYPVAFLQGRAPGEDGSQLRVVNRSVGEGEFRSEIAGGRFKALVRLAPGANHLTLAAGEQERSLTLRYRPQTNPYTVRFVYFTDRSGETAYETQVEDDPQDYAARIDVGARLMQTFLAEQLHRRGHGRRTVNLEEDAAGRVRVRTVRGPEATAFYHAREGNELYRHVQRWLNENLTDPRAKNVAFMAFSRWDPERRRALAHTALGGGNLALFSSSGFFAWANRLEEVPRAFGDATRVDGEQVHDDSGNRNTFWGLYATTLGAALHELGHTLGLGHSEERFDVMSRGFDHLNRFFTLVEPPSARREEPLRFAPDEEAALTAENAARLAASRWLQLDGEPPPPPDAGGLAWEVAAGRLVLTSPAGLREVAVRVGGLARSTETFPEGAVRRLEYAPADLRARAGSPDFEVVVTDWEGNEAVIPGSRVPG